MRKGKWEEKIGETRRRLARMPAVTVVPLLPPQPTSISLALHERRVLEGSGVMERCLHETAYPNLGTLRCVRNS